MLGRPAQLTRAARLFLTLLALGAALPLAFVSAPAQDAAPRAQAEPIPQSDQLPPVDRRDVDKAEFHAMVDGRTVYFELEDGTLWGREYYIAGTQRTVFEFYDGECFNGDWRKEGPYYCYYYTGEPSCWLTYYEGDQLTVLSRSGAKQRVRKITEETLSCDADLLTWSPSLRTPPFRSDG